MSTHFLIHDRVAAGGMGVVHAGTMVSAAGRRRVAIKRLTAEGEMSAAAHARLIAEARLVFQLTHRNICQVLDLGAGDQGAYIVMEFVDGLDLRALLRQLAAAGSSLDVASCVYVAREVAQALDYAHRRADDGGQPLALVHGDVTPGNILVSVEGEVKLTDFGIARALGTTAPGTHLVGGTPGYLPPESDAGVVDHRSDIYSLGVTLFTALTGRDPEEGFSPAALRRHRPEASADLDQAIRRMTASRPTDRFLSAAEVEQTLALELARRYPSFTPSSLARIVRSHSRGPADDASSIGTLTSLTTAVRDDEPITIPDSPAALDPAPVLVPTATRTARSARGARTGTWLAGALALTAVAAVVFAAIWFTSDGPARAGRADAAPVAGLAPAPPPTIDAAPASAEPAHRPAVRSRRAPAREKRAYITVNSIPWGAVYVDGKKVSDDTPLYRHGLSPGRHEVKVFFPDRGTYSASRRIDLSPGAVETLGFRP